MVKFMLVLTKLKISLNSYGSHTYKLVNCDGVAHYVKFHFKTAQGIKNLPADKAHELTGSDTDYAIRDLYNAIAKGDFPSWNFFIQIMTFDEAERVKFNPFDMTKVWSQKQYPLIPVGRFTLDRNPKNYFAEVEQAGYSPSNLVPGIEVSPDRMLQGRLFAYADTHRHRIGANHMLLPVNCPYRASVKNYQRDGPMNNTDNQAGAPNYFPNSFEGPQASPRVAAVQPPYKLSGDVNRYDMIDQDEFSQSTTFWNTVLNDAERKRLIVNMAAHLSMTENFIQERAVDMFSNVSTDLSKGLSEALKLKKSSKM